MAWLTRIVADEQVEYRLKEQAGCAVVEAGEGETVVLGDTGSPAVDYRLRLEGGAALVWMGSELEVLGLDEGIALDEEGKAAARRIMAGCHPATGARLVTSRTSVRAHEKAQLTTARLVEAIEQAAEEQGVTAAGLFDGKPKQLRVFQAQQRNVNRFGEAHRMQVVTLHKLARAAGLHLADAYDETADAEAEAAKAEATARELAARLDQQAATGRPTRGQQFAAEAGQILDQAETHLATAREHERTSAAAAGHAEERASQLSKLAESEGKSRLALRLAGTSLKEQRELTQRLTAERAAYWNLVADSWRDARQALDKAWETVRDSRIAQPLGAADQPVPDRADKAAERFLEMRSTASRHGHSMDKRDRDDVSRAARRAGKFRTLAASHRAQAAHARAEKVLRATIAERFPELHDREMTGRRTVQQEQAKRAVQHQQAAVAQPQPAQSRGQSRK
ncbi:hypothetical protein [Streptomyces sp. WG5]|uniref:hypothetical protein n=1 Tax=Streptomyces sp. WG5 TaxID=3417648 RepID=UPI003CF826CC